MGSSEKTNEAIEEFANKLFKLNPGLDGVSVSAVLPPSDQDKYRHSRINGYYVKNKKTKSDRKSDEGRTRNP